MSNNIDTRSPFFPKSKSAQLDKARSNQAEGIGQSNAPDRAADIAGRTAGDARVNIPEGVRDFARIKKAADSAPEVDNTEKIARLKAQIQAGSYDVDYDQLADKMLQSEF